MSNKARLHKSNSADNADKNFLLKNFHSDENTINCISKNFHYDRLKYLTSPVLHQHTSMSSILSKKSIEGNAFMNNIINMKKFNKNQSRYIAPSEREQQVRRSLEEICKDIKEIEDFLTVTENIMRQEKELDHSLRKFYLRDNKENHMILSKNSNKYTSYPINNNGFAYKINSIKKTHRTKTQSPRKFCTPLYFRNGHIGCLEAEKAISNIQNTHSLVKQILKYENEKPLVSPESVYSVLKTKMNFDLSKGKQTLTNGKSKAKQNYKSSINKKNEKTIVETDLNETSGMDIIKKSENVNENSLHNDVDELTKVRNESNEQLIHDELHNILNKEKIPNSIENTEIINKSSNSDDIICPKNFDNLNSDKQIFVRERIRHLVRRFIARTNKVKSSLDLPPTPSSSIRSCSSPEIILPQKISKTLSQQSYQNSHRNIDEQPKKKLTSVNYLTDINKDYLFEADTSHSGVRLCASLCDNSNDNNTLDPQGRIYIAWLCVVSISFLYNAWVIPLRSTFPFQTSDNTNMWLMMDFSADIIYLLDVIIFKHRLMYLFEGFWVKDKNLTRKNYMRKLQFKLDLLSLLPLELLYFRYGTKAVYLRLPRFFKVQSFWEFFKLLDRVIYSPHIVRIGKTLLYMLYMIHLTAAFYYAYSDYQGLGVNRWVFSGKGHPYVRCFAFATKTATSIGKNPKPEREGEYIFMTIAWLMGVFVFALLIGQIRDIISTATRTRNEYRQLEDETLEYMRRMNLPNDLKKRVKMWFKFTWDQQRTLDESTILDSLPINLKTDIAISVHIQTLSKVQLFADCEEALLRDLVLKLRAVTFLPGDYVCRKGEVGREMYIIKLGDVQVMGGPNHDTVLATLSEGSVFGEISLLGINGADRRTADVRSNGFVNLFVLSKDDLNEVIMHYPNAQMILKRRARDIIRKNAAREKQERKQGHKCQLNADVVIDNPKTPENKPKLLQTVIKALPEKSPAVLLVTRGSKPSEDYIKLTKHSNKFLNRNKENNLNELEQNDNTIEIKTIRSNSPDLLSSIQQELQMKHKFINLTDSQKDLILSTKLSVESLTNENN